MHEKKRIDVVAGILIKNRRVLVSKRSKDTHLAHFWEFPGGKPEKGESDEQTLCREFREELGIAVSTGELFGESTYDYGDRIVNLRFYLCGMKGCTTPRPIQVEAVKWLTPEQIRKHRFPPANRQIIAALLHYFETV